MPSLFDVEHGIASGWYIVECSSCRARTRFMEGSPRMVHRQSSAYCPQCGSHRTATVEETVSYWEQFGLDLGLPPGPATERLVRGVYELWNPAGGDASHFAVFLKHQLIEFGVVTE